VLVALIKPPYHVGIVVAHVEQAMAELTDVLGVSWGRIQRREKLMEAPAGPKPINICYAYTIDGPPYLELIERRPDSVFDTVGLHHIGVWTEDVAGESARLEDLAWPRETVTLMPDGTTWSGGLYHVGMGCLRLEVVDIASSGPRLVHYLGGGDYVVPD
jgi:hypothetical protein